MSYVLVFGKELIMSCVLAFWIGFFLGLIITNSNINKPKY